MSVQKDTLFEQWHSEYSDLIESGKFIPERPTVPQTVESLPESGIATVGHISMPTVLQNDIPSIEAWRETVDHEYEYEKSAAFDYIEAMLDTESLDRVTSGAIRFLDTAIPDYLTELRNIGLGVTGWHDVCRQVGIEYGSSTSYHIASILMNFIDGGATKTSHKLALDRGSFSAWSESRYANPSENDAWFRNHAHQLPSQHESGYPMRNHGVTAILGQSKLAIEQTSAFTENTANAVERILTHRAFQSSVDAGIEMQIKLPEEADEGLIEKLGAIATDAVHVGDPIDEFVIRITDSMTDTVCEYSYSPT